MLLVAVIVAWGPVNRSMLMGDLRTGDADRRVRAVAALVKYGASAASGLTSALLNQAAEKPWEDASRKDAAYGLALLCDIDFVKKELEGYATEGAGEGKDSDLVRLWVMDGVLRSETTGKFTSNLYRANAKSSNVDLRLKAAEGLGRYHGEKTMEALSALAVDSDKNVALRAAQSIKEAATSKDAKLLVGLLRSESEDLRTSARMALVKVADDLALKTMGVEMRQADEALAREILSVLAEHARNPAAAAEIIAAMKHKSVGIRCQAIEAAAKGRLQETYDGILAACGDSDVKVKISALKAISHIGILGYADKCAGALEDSSPEVRIEAIDVQWKCGNHTTEVLGKFIAMLDDSSGEVSKKALDAIKTIKSRYAGKHGDDNEKWKKWWTVYQEQVSVIDKVEQAIEEVKTLFGNQNTASYKKSKEIIEEQMKNGTALLARKDLVLEIKGKGERHRQRLDSMMDDLQRMLYTSMKHQSSAKR